MLRGKRGASARPRRRGHPGLTRTSTHAPGGAEMRSTFRNPACSPNHDGDETDRDEGQDQGVLGESLTGLVVPELRQRRLHHLLLRPFVAAWVDWGCPRIISLTHWRRTLFPSSLREALLLHVLILPGPVRFEVVAAVPARQPAVLAPQSSQRVCQSGDTGKKPRNSGISGITGWRACQPGPRNPFPRWGIVFRPRPPCFWVVAPGQHRWWRPGIRAGLARIARPPPPPVA